MWFELGLKEKAKWYLNEVFHNLATWKSFYLETTFLCKRYKVISEHCCCGKSKFIITTWNQYSPLPKLHIETRAKKSDVCRQVQTLWELKREVLEWEVRGVGCLLNSSPAVCTASTLNCRVICLFHRCCLLMTVRREDDKQPLFYVTGTYLAGNFGCHSGHSCCFCICFPLLLGYYPN